MARFSVVLSLLCLSACSGNTVVLGAANVGLSTDFLQFGELAQGETGELSVTLTNTGDVDLGIASVALASVEDSRYGHVGAFSVEWDQALEDTSGTERSEALAQEDTSEPIDTASEEETDVAGDLLFVIKPGGSVPVTVYFTPVNVGDNYDAVVVRTASREYGDQEPPPDERVFADPDEVLTLATVHGVGSSSAPNALVQPRSVQFGYLWEGQSASKLISIRNAGAGTLTVDAVLLDATCSPGFTVVESPPSGSAIPAGDASVVEIDFAPVSSDEARCNLLVTTSDDDSPEQVVEMSANSGTNPSNRSPNAVIHAPSLGYVHQGWGPVQMELSVTDADQPPQTLTCKVRSALQLGASLANCVPTDESGHVFVDVPIEDALEAGLDVFVVQVTDAFGVIRKASLPILINAPFPSGDDDGDGFEPEVAENADCDDDDATSYPFAAELHDDKDNDCDGRKDEETDGADDDGDGMSEEQGDCNDADVATYAGAAEALDDADNDCDGTVDEGTSAYDDDGDGFAELDLDCDDGDAAINPSTVEVCDDGVDNNCNGLKDSAEPCASTDSVPLIVGGIRLARTAVEEGDTVQMSVLVHEADGDPVSHQWSIEGGAGVLDGGGSATVFWTAPELGADANEKSFQISYIGADDDANQTFAFAEIEVYQRGKLPSTLVGEESGGCASVGGAGNAGMVASLAAIAARMRRSSAARRQCDRHSGRGVSA